MNADTQTIKIAAAIILDEAGRMLLVRKRGTKAFMQPGGKIDHGETPKSCLVRELEEEIGISVDEQELTYVDTLSAKAANEENTIVTAELFQVKASSPVEAKAEIEELIWYDEETYAGVCLAPLTADGVLPLVK